MATRLRSDINVTPLVDIVLVLLIVFITLVPALPRVLSAALPRAGGAGPGSPTIRLTLAADGGLDLDGVPVSLEELPDRIRASSGRVVLRVHPSLPFQRATRVLDVVKGARPEAVPSLIATAGDA
jgi:biopolymer transport protein ExbD